MTQNLITSCRFPSITFNSTICLQFNCNFCVFPLKICNFLWEILRETANSLSNFAVFMHSKVFAPQHNHLTRQTTNLFFCSYGAAHSPPLFLCFSQSPPSTLHFWGSIKRVQHNDFYQKPMIFQVVFVLIEPFVFFASLGWFWRFWRFFDWKRFYCFNRLRNFPGIPGISLKLTLFPGIFFNIFDCF